MTQTLTESSAPESPDQERPGPSWPLALAGAVAAGASLAIGELIDGLSKSVPSLVVAAGDWFIDFAPGDLERQAIRIFGTNDKPALVTGVIVTVLVIGTLIGVAARRRPRVGAIAFGGFGLFGAWLVSRDPQASTGWGVVSAAVSAAGGYGAFRWLRGHGLRAAAPVYPDRPTHPHHARRTFLGYSGAVAAGALLFTSLGRRLRNRHSAESARDSVTIAASDPANLTEIETLDADIDGVSPYITPNADFYRIDTALSVPQVTPDGWKLRITGMVDEEIEFTFADIQAMEQIERVITISCVSNEIGAKLVGNAVWTGVPLLPLLERAGIQSGVEQVVGRSVDDFTAGFPLSVLQDGRDAMLAIGMNGEPLPVPHGFPARLIVPGLYGYVSAVKWLEEINLTTWVGHDGYWIPRGWSKLGPMKTTSRIDVPRRGADVAAGAVAVAGVAWAPTRGIAKVEVRVDEGAWQEAELGGVVSDDTWVQWLFRWNATSGRHTLQVRATDGNGDIQPEGPKPVAPDGAEGWHEIEVDVG